MIKRLTMWRAREAASRDAALAYWRDTHPRFVECVPGVVRYVQNHCVVGPDGSDPPYAGVGEVWFADSEAAKRALATPEWQSVLDDAATFMDLEHVSAWAEEHLIL